MSNISERPDLRIIDFRCPKCGYPRGKRDDGNQRTECAACGHAVVNVQIMPQHSHIYTRPASPDPTACVQGCIGAEAGIPFGWLGDGGVEAIVPLAQLGNLRLTDWVVDLARRDSELHRMLRNMADELVRWSREAKRVSERGRHGGTVATGIRRAGG